MDQKIPTSRSETEQIPLMERLLFGNRFLWLSLFALLTIFFGYRMLHLRPEANFLRMIPTYHPYIQNYIAHQEDLKGLGNSVRICVETTTGDIFSASYLETLREVTDEVFYISGVDRVGLKSLWTPATRWVEVTEEGFAGGPVIPASYDGSETSLEEVRLNIFKSGQIGTLVANDFRSSMILAPLYEIDSETGAPLDYQELSRKLEGIRSRFQNADIRIHITGFAKVVGELFESYVRILSYFIIAFLILLALLFYDSRCIRSTFVRAISSVVAVIWQLGILELCGYGLNPYSMLVPFLLFALGVSHGIQMFNSMAREMAIGADKLRAARLAYRFNCVPGLAALFTDGVGFASLMVIRIGVIQEIAFGASIGVAVVTCTDLLFLPLLMSCSGISDGTIQRIKKRELGPSRPEWGLLAKFTHSRWAFIACVLGAFGVTAGVYLRQDLKTGDLDPGAPELRSDSLYNRDNAYMNAHYAAGSDIFVVMLETPAGGNSAYPAVVATDRLAWRLAQLDAVKDVVSHVDYLKRLNSAYMEGNLKWLALPRSQTALDNMTLKIPVDLVKPHGKLTPIVVHLEDHKAETLQAVVDVVEAFAARNNTDTYRFLMAAGNAGIEAATNMEVEKALVTLLILVYAAVFSVCAIIYRSLRVAVCVVTPLILTSVLCEALMATAGIGVKVATLPVIAVGVGIGVDYSIYIFNKLLYYRTQGHGLEAAFYRTLLTTGRAVTFIGISLAIGVATWLFSPIKFQADMGFLLTFMFLWNMVGAMVLMPALSRFLLPESDNIRKSGVKLYLC